MKKLFYILNLLFLTLLTFGGSVFAAAPTEYVDENGESHSLAGEAVNHLSSGTISGGWYYLDSNDTSVLHVTIDTNTANNPVNIVVNGKVSLPNATNAGSFIQVPENTYVNFYAATTGSSLTIQNSYTTYVIGNSGANFGNITFNSGIYTAINNRTAIPTIGSATTSGGTITINAAASVQVMNSNAGTVAIGVGSSSNSCTINVIGGKLEAIRDSAWVYGVSAGTGNVNVSNQGYIASNVNPADQTQWKVGSGIVATCPKNNGTYIWGNESPWDAYVFGEVSIPTPQGIELMPPVNPTNYSYGGYYHSLTVANGAQLTLEEQADFLIGLANSFVDNNGNVIINSINQTVPNGTKVYPYLWNNNPGSTLTISDAVNSTIPTPTLSVYGFNNGTENLQSSQKAAVLNVYGILNIPSDPTGNKNEPVLNNYSQVNIYQTGTLYGWVINNENSTIDLDGMVITGLGNFQNNGTVELDGTVTVVSPGSFKNNETLNIGSIGTVNGNLTNEEDGIVTSQNRCYY